MRVLFIGNSYIYFNDLPGIFTEISRRKDHDVEASAVARGGWTLARHAVSPQTLGKIDQGNWDYVVLQEQSVIPILKGQCGNKMLPAVRQLEKRIRRNGAKPILFMTWGRRNGESSYGFRNFQTMQAKITNCYLRVGKTLNIMVAPVGAAWENGKKNAPLLDFWADDNSHPNQIGSYLAACVVYAVIFRESPEGAGDHMNFGRTKAEYLQKTAAGTVLGNPAKWYLK